MGTGELLGKPDKIAGVTYDGLASRPGEVEILLATSCYRNRDKLWQLWAGLGSKASLFFSVEVAVDLDGNRLFYIYSKQLTRKPSRTNKLEGQKAQ